MAKASCTSHLSEGDKPRTEEEKMRSFVDTLGCDEFLTTGVLLKKMMFTLMVPARMWP
jgi:hypothetical protein